MARLPLWIVVLLVAAGDLAALTGGLAVFVLAVRSVPDLLPWALAALPVTLWGAAFASVKLTDFVLFSHVEDDASAAASGQAAAAPAWSAPASDDVRASA